jgi:1,2-diacylglycerol 3-alpha-glucosyltransferase
MRVLMVSDVYFPRINGVSTSIETFRATLPELGIDTTLVAPRYADEPDAPGLIRVPSRPVLGDPEDRLAHYGKLRSAVLEAAAGCDLIHIQTHFASHYAGLHAAHRLGKPVLATYHTLFEEYLQHYVPFLPARWLKGFARRLSRGQCNTLDAVIVPSSAMRERLLSYGASAPLHVLPTGLPEAAFRMGDRTRFRIGHGIPDDRPVALFVGRVAHEKNILFLLEAVAIARNSRPDLLLIITGEGPARADLERRTAELGMGRNVRFIGYLDRRTELPDAYAAADVFAFASRTETQGLVLLEAMAQGCPVLALSIMGTADILAPSRGCRSAPDNVEKFARSLLTLLDDRQALSRLGVAARTYAEEWRGDVIAQRLAKLYGDLAQCARAG